LNHDFHHNIWHRRGWRDLLGIDIKTFEEIGNTFKELAKCVIAFTDADSCLMWINITKVRLERRAMLTERRISMPMKTALAGWNGTCSEAKKDNQIWGIPNTVPGASEAIHLAKNARKRMNNPDYWAKAVDQAAIFVSIVFERWFSF
jgi:hypothetical protein